MIDRIQIIVPHNSGGLYSRVRKKVYSQVLYELLTQTPYQYPAKHSRQAIVFH